MAPRRRGRGEGSIFFHEGKRRWVAKLTVGYTAAGKRRRRAVFAPTKAKLLERLQALRQAATTGTLPEPNRITLAAFLDRWLAGANYRPKTRADYASAIRTHITPRLGGVAVSRLTPLAVQSLLVSLEGDGVGLSTREKVYDILHRSLRDAVAWRLVARHPCEGVGAPNYTAPPITPFTPAELVALFDAARGDRLYALYVLLGTSGLRVGEVLGLTWDALDFARGTVTITQQLSEVRGHLALADVKTPRARRELHLTILALDALREHRKRQLVAGHYRADGLVFTDTDGGPLRRSNLRRRSFYPLLAKAKLPRRTIHSLRHAVATALLCDGVPAQVVSAILGHARPSITMNVYAAYLPNMGKDAADRLDRLLSGGHPMDTLTGGIGHTTTDSGGTEAEGEKPVRTPLLDVGGQQQTVH